MEDKISVVVPIYNVEDYLKQCVDSIIKQDYDNLEIILVDDGSTDQCGEICDAYAKHDSRIRVIHKPNGGLSDARNAGMDITTGEYITFVDSDDALTTDTISYLYRILKDNNADISCCQRIEIDETGNPLHKPNTIDDSEILMFDVESAICSKDVDTVAWGKLYKIELFADVRYPVGRLHEDIFTTHKLIGASKKIVVGYKPGYLYRLRTNSISNVRFTHKHLDIIYGKIEKRDYLKIHFPSLESIGNADIVYGACICSIRMAKANYKNKADIKFVQKQIRLYERDFLKYGKNRLSTKLFSLLAFCNLNLTLKLYRCLL